MQIGKILFPVTTLGPGKRVGVWVQGCTQNCPGCSNPELKVFDESKEISVKDLITLVTAFGYDGVTVSGGEPFLQASELKVFIEALYEKGTRDILVYTGFTTEWLRSRHDPDIDYILTHIAVLIDGPFIQSLADDVPLRGSSNQRVTVFRDELKNAYAECVRGEKRVDIFSFGAETHFIGIPVKDFDTVYADYVKIKYKNED